MPQWENNKYLNRNMGAIINKQNINGMYDIKISKS